MTVFASLSAISHSRSFPVVDPEFTPFPQQTTRFPVKKALNSETIQTCGLVLDSKL